MLDPPQSAALRDKLLREVASLTSADVTVTWASQALPAKNSLAAADAKLLEEAFEQKLSALSSSPIDQASPGESAVTVEMAPAEEHQVPERPLAFHEESHRPAVIEKNDELVDHRITE